MDGCISRGYHCYIPDFGQVGLPHQSNAAVEPSVSVSSLKEKLTPLELPDSKISDREVSVAEIPDDTDVILNRLNQRKVELLDRKANLGDCQDEQEINAWITEIEQYCSDYDRSSRDGLNRLVDNLTDLAKQEDFKDIGRLDAVEGLCYGLAFSHIQSVITGTQKEFAEALQLLSRSSEAGWLYGGKICKGLDEPINLAFNDYRNYAAHKAGQPVPEGKSLFFDLFAKDHPESFKYMQLPARMNSLTVYQVPETTFLKKSVPGHNGVKVSSVLCPWAFNDTPADQSPFQTTRTWVITATPDGLEGILGSLSAGAYLLAIGRHALSVDIAGDRHALSVDIADETITVFNQNSGLYFVQAKKNEDQSLKMLARTLHYCLSESVRETDDLIPVPFSIKRIDKQSADAQEQDQKLKSTLEKYGSGIDFWGHKANKTLELAILADNLQSVRSLLSRRSLDHEGDQGESLLRMALSNGAGIDVVKALVDAGATCDTNRECYEGLQQQKSSTRWGKRRLIPHSRMDTRDFGRELIRCAIEGNNPETLRWIFSGEFKFLPCGWGIRRENSFLKEALDADCMNAARELIRSGLPDVYSYKQPSPEEIIDTAIRKGEADIVDTLLEKCGWPHSSLLQEVICSPDGDLYGDMLSVLLKHIPKGVINSKDDYGKSPLYCAVTVQNFNTINRLFEHGATIAPEGEPPLMAAIETGSLRLVEWLLDKGSNPNQCKSNNTTPLRCAIESGRPDIVGLLLKRGAVPGHDDCDKAVEIGDLEVVKIFLNKNRESKLNFIPDLLFKTAIQYRHIEIAELLIEGGVSVKSESGLSALDRAVSNGYPEMVKFLLVHGIQIDRIDHQGNSILHKAVERFDVEMVTTIVKCCRPFKDGHAFRQVNKKGLNPLDIACRYKNIISCNMIKSTLSDEGFKPSEIIKKVDNKRIQQARGRRRRGGRVV